MVTKPGRGLSCGGLTRYALKRRDLLKLGLASLASSYLNTGCEKKSATNSPDESAPAYELTEGRTLYDDFDGNGGLQTYNNRNLAEAGKLSSALWEAPTPGSEIVQDPAIQGFLTVVNEEGSQKLLWVGGRNGRCETEGGSMVVEKGKIYGNAELERVGERGRVLKLSYSLLDSLYCLLTSRRGIEFADFRTLSADVLLPSTSTCPGFFASLCYHTTIPEQSPGLSWVSDLGIRKYSSGEVVLFATIVNRNTGYQYSMIKELARLDTWYNLRMEVVTQRDDPALKGNQLRVEYFVNGELLGSEIPEDAELLLNPERTGAGPHRFLRLCVTVPEGEGFAFFDNVRAVYLNRTK